MTKNVKVTLGVITDYIRIRQIKTTYTALASTLALVAIASIIYLRNTTSFIYAAVLLVFAALNLFGSSRFLNNDKVLLESEFDIERKDYEYFLRKYNSNRITNIVLLIISIILLITSVAVPAYFILVEGYPNNFIAMFFAIIAISIHFFLAARTNVEVYNKFKTKLDQLFG